MGTGENLIEQLFVESLQDRYGYTSININHILSVTSYPCCSTSTTWFCGSALFAKVLGAKHAALLGKHSRTFPMLLIYRLAYSSKLKECSAILSKLQQKYRQQGEAGTEQEISQKLVGLFSLILGEVFVSRDYLCANS